MPPDVRVLVDDGVVVCPACRGRLDRAEEAASCVICSRSYPLVDGTVPVLLTETSLFTAEDVIGRRHTHYRRKAGENRWKQRLRRSLPSLASDAGAATVEEILRRECAAGGLGVVVGGGERVGAMEARVPQVQWLVGDVDLSYGAHLVADAGALPIADGAADVVVAEMVLEHVPDPFLAAGELQRVVRDGGLVVVTVPFCFPWHGIPWDFHRFTPTGLRLLLDRTEVVHLGPGQGPAGAVAYLADALLVNASGRRFIRMALAFVSRFVFGWLKWLDRGRSGAGPLVSAGSLTYVGRKVVAPIPRRRLVAEVEALWPGGRR